MAREATSASGITGDGDWVRASCGADAFWSAASPRTGGISSKRKRTARNGRASTTVSAQEPLLQILGGRLRAQPDREDRIRESLSLEHAQLLAPGGERRALPRQVGERQRAAVLHVGHEREHLVERSLLGGPVLHVPLEAFLKGLDELRLRQVAQEMHADGLGLIGREDGPRILGG